MRLLLLFSALGFAATESVADDLFDVLDSDGNGLVTADEISEAQRPHFDRALRVADVNEDGMLTRAELKSALTDPKPVSVPASAQGQGSQFDIRRFDRNGDGNISKDEIPQQLRQRFQPLFARFGKDAIPVQAIRQMLRGQSQTPGRAQLTEAFKRLDTDKDGKLNRAELRRSPQLARFLDRNRDGEISAEELKAALQQQTDRSDDAKPNQTTDQQLKQISQIFDRLDRNQDGKLSREEVPQNMRSNFARADRNGDNAVSRAEFVEAAKRKMQSDQKQP